jgi:hypothetical protein
MATTITIAITEFAINQAMMIQLAKSIVFTNVKCAPTQSLSQVVLFVLQVSCKIVKVTVKYLL